MSIYTSSLIAGGLTSDIVTAVANQMGRARANPIRLNNVCKGTVGVGGIDGVATSLPVDAVAAATAPQVGIFPIKVEEEHMMVTAGAGTTTWTVTRGINTTVAAAHLATVAIECGPLSFTFPANNSPSQGDVAANRKIYPTPNATVGLTQGVWQIPEIMWQPFPASMWENQASSTTQTSDSQSLFNQNLNRVLLDPAALQQGLPQGHMVFNGPTLDMLHATVNVTQLHMLVDEGAGWMLPCVGSISNFGSPAGKWVTFNFGSRKTRKISIYGDGNPCGSQGYFGAFAIGTKDALVAYPRTSEPTVAIFDDSFAQLDTAFARGGHSAELAHKLGLHVQNWNVRGGTGYYNNGGTTGGDGYSRMKNELNRWNPNVILVSLGLNDNPTDLTGLNTVTSFYSFIRGRQASSLIIVIGAIRSKESDGTGRNPLNARILSALQAISGPWIFVNPNGSTGGQKAWYASNGASGDLVADSWITGSGRIGALSGIGNRDIFIGTDDSHPIPIGCDYISERAYQGVLNGMSSLVGYPL